MDEREKAEREKVVAIARSWLRTPYHDLAKVKGAGVDCGQLIGATFEEAGLIENFSTGYYSPQFYLHHDGEPFLAFVRKYAHDIEPAAAIAGDLVVYKFGRCFAHGAIIVSPGWPRIVHAHKPSRSVVEEDGSIGPLGDRDRLFFSRW